MLRNVKRRAAVARHGAPSRAWQRPCWRADGRSAFERANPAVRTWCPTRPLGGSRSNQPAKHCPPDRRRPAPACEAISPRPHRCRAWSAPAARCAGQPTGVGHTAATPDPRRRQLLWQTAPRFSRKFRRDPRTHLPTVTANLQAVLGRSRPPQVRKITWRSVGQVRKGRWWERDSPAGLSVLPDFGGNGCLRSTPMPRIPPVSLRT